MFHATLPANIQSGENKGKPAFRVIANDKLGYPADPRDKEGNVTKETALRIAQKDIAYPQFGPEPSTKTEGEGDKARTVEIPLTDEQARQGIEEAIQDAGGPVAFLDAHNNNTRDEAVKEGLSYIRQYDGTPDTDVTAVIKTALNKIRTFTWKAAEKVTVAQFKQELAQLKDEDIDNMDPAVLKARMKKLLGQA